MINQIKRNISTIETNRKTVVKRFRYNQNKAKAQYILFIMKYVIEKVYIVNSFQIISITEEKVGKVLKNSVKFLKITDKIQNL